MWKTLHSSFVYLLIYLFPTGRFFSQYFAWPSLERAHGIGASNVRRWQISLFYESPGKCCWHYTPLKITTISENSTGSWSYCLLTLEDNKNTSKPKAAHQEVVVNVRCPNEVGSCVIKGLVYFVKKTFTLKGREEVTYLYEHVTLKKQAQALVWKIIWLLIEWWFWNPTPTLAEKLQPIRSHNSPQLRHYKLRYLWLMTQIHTDLGTIGKCHLRASEDYYQERLYLLTETTSRIAYSFSNSSELINRNYSA